MIKVAIIEDDARVRASLTEIIDNAPGYRCVCGCATAEMAFETIPPAFPDVVLMDIHLPSVSSIECAIRLKQDLPNVQILMLTVYENSGSIFGALQRGASGPLLKRTPCVELLDAIAEAARGGAPMTSELARRVVERFHSPCQPSDSRPELSRREHEILDLLIRGYINKEIGELLCIGVETVRTHLKHVYEKLHVHSRTEAVAKYLGLVEKRLPPSSSYPREVAG